MLSFPFILFFSCALHSFFTLAEEAKGDDHDTSGVQVADTILCRKCGSDIADSSYVFHKHSPGALRSKRMKLFGQQNVTIQTLVNPFGVHFDVITVEKARCQHMGLPQSGDSWFPGYEWRICICPRCGHHLGWTFQSVPDTKGTEDNKDKEFHGLVLSSILEENYIQFYDMIGKTCVMLSLGCLFAYVLFKHVFTFRKLCYGLFNNDAQNIPDVNENLV